MAQLATLASKRLLSGFRPSTLQQYTCMWKDFLSFQVAAGLPNYQVNTDILLSFMEFLHSNSLSPDHIANYMAPLRAFHILCALQTDSFQDKRIPLFLKALKIQAPLKVPIRSHIDIDLLSSLIALCDVFPHSHIFKALYLLCYFSFLRLSNILPHATTSFDPTRQLARADFISAHQGAVLLIKWSKTMQDRKQAVTIPLPDLGASPLCPIAALHYMIKLVPADSNDPLFLVPRTSRTVPLTDSVARKHLKNISKLLHLTTPLTFHDFRRAGARWAFQQGVLLEHIMKHGTWKSDAVWYYLSSSASTSSPVSLAFQAALRP